LQNQDKVLPLLCYQQRSGNINDKDMEAIVTKEIEKLKRSVAEQMATTTPMVIPSNDKIEIKLNELSVKEEFGGELISIIHNGEVKAFFEFFQGSITNHKPKSYNDIVSQLLEDGLTR